MHLFLFTRCIDYRYLLFLLFSEGELFLQDFWSKETRRKYLAYGQHLNWSSKDKKAEYLSELLGQHSAMSWCMPWVLEPLLMCFLIYCLCKNNEVDVCGEKPAWLTSRQASSSSWPLFFQPITRSTYKKPSMRWQERWGFVSSPAGFSRSPVSRSLSLLLPLLSFLPPPSVPCGLLGCSSSFQCVQWGTGHGLVPVGKPIPRHLRTAHPGQGLQIQCYSCTLCSVGGVCFSNSASKRAFFGMM